MKIIENVTLKFNWNKANEGRADCIST